MKQKIEKPKDKEYTIDKITLTNGKTYKFPKTVTVTKVYSEADMLAQIVFQLLDLEEK